MLVIGSTGNSLAMRSTITINYDPYYQSPVSSAYPIAYLPTYYPTYSYSYWPTYTYYDPYYDSLSYFWDDCCDNAKGFVKTCMTISAVALVFALIGSFASR